MALAEHHCAFRQPPPGFHFATDSHGFGLLDSITFFNRASFRFSLISRASRHFRQCIVFGFLALPAHFHKVIVTESAGTFTRFESRSAVEALASKHRRRPRAARVAAQTSYVKTPVKAAKIRLRCDRHHPLGPITGLADDCVATRRICGIVGRQIFHEAYNSGDALSRARTREARP